MPPHFNQQQQMSESDFIFGDSQKYQQQQQPQVCSFTLFGHGSNHLNNNNNNGPTPPLTTENNIRRDHGSPDEELAKEMNALSMTERDKVLEDVHGVAEEHAESDIFLAECQHEMDLALSKIPKSKRRGYDRALFFMPSIENDMDFRLMFLRANGYDGNKAAMRLIKYYEDKLDLFGEDRLTTKDITVNDLTEEDLNVFSTGWIVELPHKDQVGRPIIFFDATRYDYDNIGSMLRCAWYSMMVSIQRDETAQKKGISAVVYAPGDLWTLPSSLKNTRNLFSKFNDIIFNLPIRFTSYHVCYDDPRMEFFLKTIRNVFGKQLRLRRKLHFGSELEIQYSLAAYGISCGMLLQGTRDHAYGNEDAKQQLHKKYIDRRKEIERQEDIDRVEKETSSGIILYPQPKDVLVGRGRPYQDYTGNLQYGRLIESNLDLYHKHIDKFSKTCLSMDIVKQVKAYGGRFIERTKEEEGTWRVIDDNKAREKTAISFRSRIGKVTSDPEWQATKASRARGGSNRAQHDRNAKRFRYV